MGRLFGHKVSEETRGKISNSLKGNTPWNKDKKGVQVSCRKGKKYPQITGDKHPAWKGDKVGYYALHTWVVRQLGKPSECAYCGSDYYVHYANVSREYKRDLSDFVPLCIKCHRKFDNWSQKMWATRRLNYE